MEKKNKIILAVVIAAAVIAIIIAAVVSSKPEGKQSAVNGSGSSQTSGQTAEQATEEPIVTPTLVYILSQSDTANYQAAMAAIDSLKAEYEGKINFDIRDVDTDKESAEGFGSFGVPSAIMLDNHNNICAFVSPVVDPSVNPTNAEDLRTAVKKALGE